MLIDRLCVLLFSYFSFQCNLDFVESDVSIFSLQLSVLEYQTAVMRSDFDTADRILPTVPSHYRTRVAHFLEKQVIVTSLIFLGRSFSNHLV